MARSQPHSVTLERSPPWLPTTTGRVYLAGRNQEAQSPTPHYVLTSLRRTAPFCGQHPLHSSSRIQPLSRIATALTYSNVCYPPWTSTQGPTTEPGSSALHNFAMTATSKKQTECRPQRFYWLLSSPPIQAKSLPVQSPPGLQASNSGTQLTGLHG